MVYILQVFAEGRDQEIIRSDEKMTASAIEAQEHSYLSLEVEKQFLEPGKNLKVTLRDITPQGAPKPTFFYFMVRTASASFSFLLVGLYQVNNDLLYF